MFNLLKKEKFTNIQRAQAGLTRLFEQARKDKTYYRVMKNDQPLGVLVPDEVWFDLIEDMEALASPAFLQSIEEARLNIEKGEIFSHEEVFAAA